MRTEEGLKRVKAVKNAKKRLFLRVFVHPSLSLLGRVPAETSAILRSGMVAPVQSSLYSAKDAILKGVVKITIMG